MSTLHIGDRVRIDMTGFVGEDAKALRDRRGRIHLRFDRDVFFVRLDTPVRLQEGRTDLVRVRGDQLVKLAGQEEVA